MTSSDQIPTYLTTLLKGGELRAETAPEGDTPEEREAFRELHLLSDQLAELKRYSLALARGNLDVEFPPRKNYLVGGLKELHANMLHLIWKVDEVAKGDYGQQLDYMGQISDAFNRMAAMLNKRDSQVKQSQNVLSMILSYSDVSLFVLDKATGEFIHGRENLNNHVRLLDMDAEARELVVLLQQKELSEHETTRDWKLFAEKANKWYTVTSSPGNWDGRDVYFHVVSDISEAVKLGERLKDAMYRDAKFSVYNQAYALKHIGQLIDNNAPFTVCYMDLDNLKATNDALGHDAGDHLIRRYIKLISDQIRSNDVFCRLGGDEFLLILANLPYEAAQNKFLRVAKQVEDYRDAEYPTLRLSFSYGIETVAEADYAEGGLRRCKAEPCSDPHCGEPLCIINRADRKMYEQKRQKKQGQSDAQNANHP